MISRPYLTESIASGDKFNIGAFLALCMLLALFALWIYSSKDLFGGFIDWVAGKSKTQLNQVADVVDGDNVFVPALAKANGQNQGDINLDVAITVIQPTPENTATSFPTPITSPTPAPTLGVYRPLPPVKTQIPMMDFEYDNDDMIQKINHIYGSVVEGMEYDLISGKYSYYWPPLGGINCDADCNTLSDGRLVKDNIVGGWACPLDFDIGTYLFVEELNLYGVCVDRGGAIKLDTDGLYWFDHLTRYPMATWTQPLTIRIYK